MKTEYTEIKLTSVIVPFTLTSWPESISKILDTGITGGGVGLMSSCALSIVALSTGGGRQVPTVDLSLKNTVPFFTLYPVISIPALLSSFVYCFGQLETALAKADLSATEKISEVFVCFVATTNKRSGGRFLDFDGSPVKMSCKVFICNKRLKELFSHTVCYKSMIVIFQLISHFEYKMFCYLMKEK